MAVTYVNKNDHDLAFQVESTYGTDPGAVAGTDFFKSQADPGMIKRVIARYDRQGDNDYAQGSVLSTTKGREHSEITIPFDIIPNGATGTPTKPDISDLLKVHFGTESTLTAHTTTDTGSVGTSIVLAAGGGAASGIPAGGGCLIACNVSSGVGVEVRRVISRSTDTLTIDRAFTADPATGRAVYVGTTYKYSSSTQLSGTLKQFIGGSTVKNKVTGVILPNLSIDCDAGTDEVVVKGSVSGMGTQLQSLADSRPSITTNGVPLAGIVGKIWIGSTKFCATKVGFTSNNAAELRKNEFCSLYPRGVKRTGNNGRFLTSMSIDLFYSGGDEDVQTIYANAQSLTAQSVIVQLGDAVGAMVAWACPRFIADPSLTSINGEFGVNFGGGRCYGTSGDDEIFFTVF